MEENVEITYNNSKYGLVDSAEIEGKEVYHFMSYKMIDFLIDDKKMPSINEHNLPVFSLFCTKENGVYIPIRNKKEEKKLLEEFGVIFQRIIPSTKNSLKTVLSNILLLDNIANFGRETESVEGEDREKFIQEQKENYRGIKQKLGLNIDLAKIENKLSKMKINIYNGEMPTGVSAFYSIDNNDVNFKEEDISSDKLRSKIIRLHETNHYLAGKSYSYINTFSKGILEGVNENLVTDFFDNNTSSFHYFLDNPNEKIAKGNPYMAAQVQYNFMRNIGYPHLVSLVKQLEYITGVKSYESSINGDNNFIKAIVRGLGIIPTMKLCAVTNTMVLPRTKGIEFVNKIKMLQNMIMQVSFDKQFDQIQSPQDAQVYLQRLREFEKYRGKIIYLTKEGEIVKDNTYKNYYEAQLAQIKTRFGEKADLFEEYRYKEQEFKPTLSERDDQVKSEIRERLIMDTVVKSYGDANRIPRQMSIEMLKKDDNWMIYKINGQICEKPLFNIGRRNVLLLKSIILKNKQKSGIEIRHQLMKLIGATKQEMAIEYTEEEINKGCKEFIELRKKAEKDVTRMIKKPTLIDKIKQKIYEFKIKREEKAHQSETAKVEPKADTTVKKPSWDLSNWSQDEYQGNKSVEAGKEAENKKDYDIDIE